MCVTSSGGAETSARSRVTCESISVVACSADSTSVFVVVEIERECGTLRLEMPEQVVGEVAVAGLGRDAPGGGVRMREQPERLELGQLGANGRRRDAKGRRRSTSAFDPTGCFDATNSSTTRRMICSLPLAQLHLFPAFAGRFYAVSSRWAPGGRGSRKDLGRDAAAEEAPASRERLACPLRFDGQPETLGPREAGQIERRPQPLDLEAARRA